MGEWVVPRGKVLGAVIERQRWVESSRSRLTAIDPERTVGVGHRGVSFDIFNVCQIERRAGGARSGKRQKCHDEHLPAHSERNAITVRSGSEAVICDRPLSTHCGRSQMPAIG